MRIEAAEASRSLVSSGWCSEPNANRTPWLPGPGARPAEFGVTGSPRNGADMKKIFELLLCILHPIAVVLIWINLLSRGDLGFIAKLTWAIVAIVPFVPFVYVLTGNDFI